MTSDIKDSRVENTKLGSCQICTSNAAKYTCPACCFKTCSLQCVKTHKKNANCSGIRSKTAMIHKEDMDNFTLLSDYRFLEEIDHKLDDTERDPLRRHLVVRNDKKPTLPHFLLQLKSEAWKRGTHLRFMPSHFAAHKDNSTRYYFKEGIIRWHIKWIFHQADISFIDKSIDENTPIVNLLTKYLEPNDKLSPEESEKLAYYQSASYKRIAVLWRSEERGTGPAFEEMFVNKSLRLNLANKTVMEYPVFYVILKDHIHSYLEITSGDHEDLFSQAEEGETQKDDGLTYFQSE